MCEIFNQNSSLWLYIYIYIYIYICMKVLTLPIIAENFYWLVNYFDNFGISMIMFVPLNLIKCKIRGRGIFIFLDLLNVFRANWWLLTHLGQVEHHYVSKLDHNWLIYCLGACSTPGHYLKQIVNWSRITMFNEIWTEIQQLSYKKIDFCLSTDWHMAITLVTYEIDGYWGPSQ